MKTNKIILYSIFVISFTFLVSCNDDFLNRYPLDSVTEYSFFNTPKDLEIYMNRFYSTSFFKQYSNHGDDFNSDNQVGPIPNTRLLGTRLTATSGSIGFGNVRSINFFFDHCEKVKKAYPIKDYQQSIGEAYFFRALIYYQFLQNYGDIQWITKTLNTSSPELYSNRDPRNVVADNIIASLDSAVLYLQATKTTGAARINKWIALLVQSRVALYEGSWEKYHNNSPFGVSNAQPEKYFTKAAEAAKALINSGLYDLYSTGKPLTDYNELFALQDFSTNKEIMFWRSYKNELTRGETSFRNDRNFRMETPSNNSITKQLADAYLCSDGKPIGTSPLFMGYNTLAEEATNRDPRFYQTIALPTSIWKIHLSGAIQYWSQIYSSLNSKADNNSPGGYINMKGYNPTTKYHVQQFEESPGIIYRYAEALLNFAEAKAELGTLSQQDLDISINKLRTRVGMPHLKVNEISNDPNWDFPTLSPLINEIRRERRIELACEGYRADDIDRWAAADELIVGKRPKGFKASQIRNNPFPVDENGFLDPFQNVAPNGYGFDIGRDYLSSIPITELVLNPNLVQNPGWETGK